MVPFSALTVRFHCCSMATLIEQGNSNEIWVGCSMRNRILPIILLDLFLAVALLSGCVSVPKYEAVQSEHASLLQENTNLKMELEEMKLKLDSLSTNYDEYRRGYDELKADYNELNINRNELKTDYDELKADYDELLLSYNELRGDDEITSVELDEIKEVPQSVGLITRQYTWVYGGREWSWDVQIPQALYNYYKQLPRPPTSNYSVYVTHPMDDAYLDSLIDNIKNASQQTGYSELQTIEFAIAFVQGLPYTADSVTTPYDEYPRYPIETLLDNGGDCEDTSILLASLLDSLGYGVVLIIPPSHAAIGLLSEEGIYGTYWEYEGGKYYYIETTGTGWEIGQLPEVYEDTSASIFPMIPIPIITHEWNIKSVGNTYELEVRVSNSGSGTAENVVVLAGFDAGEGMIWNGELSDPFQVGVGQQVTVKLYLRPPLGEHTRLVVQIGIDGIRVDESYSEWVDT